jgi:alanine-alpha-ketoisovalerate/valine-pyruvate aminotransferase
MCSTRARAARPAAQRQRVPLIVDAYGKPFPGIEFTVSRVLE